MNIIPHTTFKKGKWLFTRLVPGILIGVVFVGSSTHVANAVESTNVLGGVATFLGLNLFDLIAEGLANVFYNLQVMASWLVALSGALLNFSINLTMHIKEFVNATPAIYTVWAAIRDLSGMFIIFALLYAAIMLITGVKDAGFSKLIKNVVIAGVLINFSFFITGLAIDVSNIVSLQLYNAIVPSQGNVYEGNLKKDIGSSIKTPGLSNIFMQSLGITRLYSTGGTLTKANQEKAGTWSTPIKVIIIGITSIIIMITAALSFFLASLAFVVRFVILLFLLAFSPIVFAASVVPEIDKYAKDWWGYLKGQLVFMPVYLLLMYFALSVLTSSSIFNTGYAGPLTAGGDFASDLLVIGVNATLIIVMLNIPLLAAITLGAKVPGWSKNVDALSIWKKVGGFAKGTAIGVGGAASGLAYRKTVGRAATELNKKWENTPWGNSILGRDFRAATLGKAASFKAGGKRSFDEHEKEQKNVEQKNREIGRRRDFNRIISTGSTTQIQAALEHMGTNERLALGPDNLTNIAVLKHIKKSDLDAIKKSDNFTDDQKSTISASHLNAFRDAINNHEGDVVRHMMNNIDMDDVVGVINTVYRNTGNVPDFIVQHLNQGKLDSLVKEGIDDQAKRNIGNQIYRWHTVGGRPRHSAFGFIGKNYADWT